MTAANTPRPHHDNHDHDKTTSPSAETESGLGSLGLDRRDLFRLTGGVVGVGALGLSTGTAGAFAARDERPVSMAMHIHGSFSEGIASMDAHLYQAERLGVDVIWWTDHDFRMSAHGYRTGIGFDGPSEPADGWDLTWLEVATGGFASRNHRFVSAPSNPDEPGSKMEVTARAADGADWSTYFLEARSENAVYSTSYSDTVLALDVMPQSIGPNAQPVVEVVSSYRPATHGRPAGQYRIQFRVGAPLRPSHEEDGLLGVIGVSPGAVDQWQHLALDLKAAHEQLWPDTVAADASLWRLRLGLRVRDGAAGSALFDRLRFQRSRTSAADGVDLRMAAIHEYRKRYPGVRQFSSAEVSLVMHLNAFGGDGRLPKYRSPDAHKNPSPKAQLAMVKFLRRHHATVSLNHPMGGSHGATNLARRLVLNNGMGADVIEVGTRLDFSKVAGAFDIASRNAVFLTANGSTDDHQGIDWLGPRRRWLTKVWSPTRRRNDLCGALRAGRAWFYDPLVWDGHFDLLVDGSTRMGGVHFTPKKRVNLRVTATEMPPASTLEIIIGRCDLAGAGDLRALNRTIRVPKRQVRNGHWSHLITPGDGVYIRAMVRRHNGVYAGFSNPVWVLPPRLRARVHVPPARR